METTTVPVERAVAVAAWSIGGALLVAGWIVYLRHYADLGMMLTVTSVPFVAVGALMMVRCWAAGLARVVRLTASLGGGSGGVAPFR